MANNSLNDLSPFIYGTTRLGDEKIAIEDRVKVARAAMEAGVWFHTSDQYGTAMNVLRTAFDQDRARVPKLIYKIGWSNVAELRTHIHKQLSTLGLKAMDLGQLCLGGELAEQFKSGGACYAEFRRLKEEGIVKRLVVEVFPWTSSVPLEAIRGGHTDSANAGIIDGYIFYLNPLQRFASNALWDLLQERQESIVAMRTVGGGDVHRLRDVPGAAWKEYLQQRAAEVAPIFERSGCATWAEFCVRFPFGFSQVKATVGSTSRLDGLRAFTDAAATIKPLPSDIQQSIATLQRRWSDETDIGAEPWSM